MNPGTTSIYTIDNVDVAKHFTKNTEYTLSEFVASLSL